MLQPPISTDNYVKTRSRGFALSSIQTKLSLHDCIETGHCCTYSFVSILVFYAWACLFFFSFLNWLPVATQQCRFRLGMYIKATSASSCGHMQFLKHFSGGKNPASFSQSGSKTQPNWDPWSFHIRHSDNVCELNLFCKNCMKSKSPPDHFAGF